MSDTPISDSTPHNVADLGMLCRKLEHELNTANDEIEEKRKDVVYLATEKAKLEERIKRLEEMYEGEPGERPDLLGSNVMGLLKRELNSAQQRIKRLEEAGDDLHWAWMNPFDPAGETIVDNWRKAKEAKP